LVGGDRAIERRLSELLEEQCGVTSVHRCETADAAGERFETDPSSAVLIDFWTIRSGTVPLIQRLRSRSSTVLVVVSAVRAEAAIGEAVLGAGADHWVAPPRDIDELVRIFSSW